MLLGEDIRRIGRIPYRVCICYYINQKKGNIWDKIRTCQKTKAKKKGIVNKRKKIEKFKVYMFKLKSRSSRENNKILKRLLTRESVFY